MNPCPNQRRAISLLACSAIPPQQADLVRGHLSKCEGCRQYFLELSSIDQMHRTAAAGLSGVEIAPALYRKVAAAIRVSPSATTTRGTLSLWWIPIAAAALVVLAVGSFPRQSPKSPADVHTATVQPAVFAPEDTSLLSYSRALAQSPERLDSLLARSANGASTSSGLTQAALLRSLNSDL